MSAEELAVDPVTAARRLLGATLYGRGVSATIVEVEAYGGVPEGPWPDAAAHSYRGLNGRNAVMFGPPGHLYTYRSHGIHVCANVACGPMGQPQPSCSGPRRSKAASSWRGPARRTRPHRRAGARTWKPMFGSGNHHGRQRA
ncbi:methylpurine-DNA glycosylase family protein [Mycobacterium xenopi 4042]|uniref:Methylpurine-DNA glycosylase family protein n=1 Tax=Mycobacterium xenopi 4042 TaxID=1299334 RepID=X8DCM6_MYCXE|nr:methylpurine-DNA glycosylase family protein [Mycobacterium xenopi 4042]